MKIAILSGKGGTGKTTVACNLAFNIGGSYLIDTDVEEPNAHLFLKPIVEEKKNVLVSVPKVIDELCDNCGRCSSFCKFSAIFKGKNKPIIFEESCHSCEGCKIVCPKEAIYYDKKSIGVIRKGKSKGIISLDGTLKIGEKSGVKIIKDLKELTKDEELLFIDCPPGASCSTVNSVEGVDYAVVVTEPTPFGLSDMKVVLEMLENMKIPHGVVINKATLGNDEVELFLKENGIKIVGKVPFDEKIAKLYSEGVIFSEDLKGYRDVFKDIFEKIKEEVL